MLSSILKSLFGTSSDRQVKRLIPLLQEVRAHEAASVGLSDAQLRARTGQFKERLSQGEDLESLLPEAFAVACEAAKRVNGMRHFDVQIIGGIVLHQGNIAEMVTGEGKTLVATLPIYLNGLTGKGVHLVTVSDYHARRDREWMGPIYEFLGLTVGLIQHDMGTAERQVGYRADVTYGTNNEFGFDYLRDNMARRPELRVQRQLNYAIVDEIDSILIDEARTPLIISGRPEKSTDLYYRVDEAVRRLRKETHYEVEEKGHHVMLTEDGMAMAENLLGVEDLYVQDSLGIVHMLEQSIRAHNFYKRDDEYVVRDGEVLIVDEFTGRMMEGRRFSDGLHQALEAKEQVAVQFESQTVASITYQNYFKLYNKLAGMTGTAATEANEFAQIYDLDVVQVPTNLPLIRDDETDLVFATEEGKFRHVVSEICDIHEQGRPVLVGTVSIEKSERVATMLSERGVSEFEVLNAKHHGREAAIVANAGRRGAITIATNMAGRGTDIKLREGVRELGGLAIIGTERHDSRRIDNQLRGRCGRQGDPGTTRFFLSLEDEVARLFGGDKVKRLLEWTGSQQEMDDQPLGQRMVSRSIERAQRQVEEYNFEIRKHLKEYDDVMNKQRQIIYQIRRDVLEDRDVLEQMRTMFENLVADMVDEYAPEDQLPENWDLEGLATRFKYVFGFEAKTVGAEDEEPQPLLEDLVAQVQDEYARREGCIAEEYRASFREEIGGDDSHIAFPKLARKYVHDLEKMALLSAVDDKWIDHLYSMDYLRESVRLRAYGQKDPLVEYKTEAFEMFGAMMASIEENVSQTLFRLTDPEVRKARQLQARRGTLTMKDDPFAAISQYHLVGADKQQDSSFASYDTSRFALAGQDAAAARDDDGRAGARRPRRQPVRHAGPQVGPNDPCPCGSGKKYKKCCGGLARN
ncbi:MAG: preprotein translocase subunit SecA [Candidatus Hydrogenedentes bacterium]|nr:preprotein translocase subunit SecA [Candidatus Hydrogenedentota bacterium]